MSERIKELNQSITEKLEQLSKDLELGHTESFKEYLDFAKNFHGYSWCNQMLIMRQRPHASLVAGFRQWQKQNRFVKKGETAIRILAPMFFKKEVKTDKGIEEKENIWFKDVCVFDVGQTDGEPIPEWKETTGEINPDTYNQLFQFAVSKSIAVTFESCGGALGLSKGGKISLEETMKDNPSKIFAVLAHELAHELLHRGLDGKSLSKDFNKEQRELEAESVAYIVAQSYGIDAMSRDYLLSYKATPAQLKESLPRIQKISSEILDYLTPETQEERKAA